MPNLLTAVREALLSGGLERYRRAENDGFDCSWLTHPGGRVMIIWRQVGGRRDDELFIAQDRALAAVAATLRSRGFEVSHLHPVRDGRPGVGVIRPMVAVHVHPGYPFRPRVRKKPAAAAAPAELGA